MAKGLVDCLDNRAMPSHPIDSHREEPPADGFLLLATVDFFGWLAQ